MCYDGTEETLADKQVARYAQIITHIFEHYSRSNPKGFVFSRDDIPNACKALSIPQPKNLGDVIYTFRFRKKLPDIIRNQAPQGLQWIIRLAGSGLYRFASVKAPWFEPSDNRVVIKVPDATPGIISRYALSDEQALLAKLRYNRLVDLFLKSTCYSLQNHLRTQVTDIGQIEIDELYLGIDRSGAQFVIPVQAKGGKDKLGIVQIEQDMAFCQAKYPSLICRSVGAQFQGNTIVLMEFVAQGDEIKVLREEHYCLVPKNGVTDSDLKLYAIGYEP